MKVRLDTQDFDDETLGAIALHMRARRPSRDVVKEFMQRTLDEAVATVVADSKNAEIEAENEVTV